MRKMINAAVWVAVMLALLVVGWWTTPNFQPNPDETDAAMTEMAGPSAFAREMDRRKIMPMGGPHKPTMTEKEAERLLKEFVDEQEDATPCRWICRHQAVNIRPLTPSGHKTYSMPPLRPNFVAPMVPHSRRSVSPSESNNRFITLSDFRHVGDHFGRTAGYNLANGRSGSVAM